MVAFYKEVCIIYGAEHPLHILWLCNFISGLVAQLGERSVRIREVEGSNPFRSTKNKPPARVDLFLPWACGSRSLSPLAGEIRPQAPKSNSREGVAFLFETTNRCIMHETPISDHNRWYMHNYYGEISLQKGTSSPKRRLLSNAVAGCRTKMLVFDKLPLHLLSVCGIFDSVKAVRGVYMGNCVPLKLC